MSFIIEAEGKTYRQEYLSSEDGLKLQLRVLKAGLMPLLQSAAVLLGSSTTEEAIKKLASDSELQGKLLAGVYGIVQNLEYEDIKMLKELLFPVTFLQRGDEGELSLSVLPKHFSTIVDNNRLFVLLAKSLKVQLAPLFSAQFISQISDRLKTSV